MHVSTPRTHNIQISPNEQSLHKFVVSISLSGSVTIYDLSCMH